jgi:hypothetical protein
MLLSSNRPHVDDYGGREGKAGIAEAKMRLRVDFDVSPLVCSLPDTHFKYQFYYRRNSTVLAVLVVLLYLNASKITT